MKYLPLLVCGLLVTPAFADDVNVKATPIPNLVAPADPNDVLCVFTGNPTHDAKCRAIIARYRPGLILVDDVNVPAKPLANETAISRAVAVDLSCVIQADASLNDCKLADGATASKQDEAMAIGETNGKQHIAGAFTPGARTNIKIVVNVGKALPLIPIR